MTFRIASMVVEYLRERDSRNVGDGSTGDIKKNKKQ